MKNNHILMLVVTICTFGLLYIMLFASVPKENVTLILAIAGPILGFYFGSSVNKAAPPASPASINDLINQAAIDAVKKGVTP